MFIKSVHPFADARRLTAADLKKAGVEEGFSATTFKRHEPTEVDDAIGEVLLNHELFAGEFAEADPDEEVQAAEPMTDSSLTQNGPVAGQALDSTVAGVGATGTSGATGTRSRSGSRTRSTATA